MKKILSKIIQNIYIALIVLLGSITIFSFALFNYELSKVSDDSRVQEVEIKPGSVSSIANTLYKKGLIRNEIAFKLYIKITGKSNLKAAIYDLSPNMGSKKIVDILYKGQASDSNKVKITFKEGNNIRKMAKIVSTNTNITEEDFLKTINDKEYLKELIKKYWFLTDDILNDKIYYALEGYLYPNTYYFLKSETTSKDIINKILEETNRQLTPLKDKLENTSIHEIITMASIVELEGVTLSDRKGIAGVFNNRINRGMNLGSDVTTYYGAKVDMGDRDLYSNEITECNNYNTRCANFTGLPVSPICNPAKEAIDAALEPTSNNYYYFVADKNRKIYFSKNINEHNNTIRKLKNEGLWYEY